jgi:hypothetical protein
VRKSGVDLETRRSGVEKVPSVARAEGLTVSGGDFTAARERLVAPCRGGNTPVSIEGWYQQAAWSIEWDVPLGADQGQRLAEKTFGPTESREEPFFAGVVVGWVGFALEAGRVGAHGSRLIR